MAIALGTSWTYVSHQATSFSYGGYSYSLTVYLQAKYSIVNGAPRVWMRLYLQKDGAGLTSSNKHYRVRQYGKDYPDPGDSGYNSDTRSWPSGFDQYALPNDYDTVYSVVSYGSANAITIVGYYIVDFAGVEINLSGSVYVPNPAPATPTMTVVVDSPTQATVTYQTASWNDDHGSMAVYDPTVTPTQDLAYSTSLGPNTFIYSGLTPNTTYQLQTRAANSYAFSYSAIATFTTPPLPPEYKLYGSVSDQTKKIEKLYGSVNGQTKEIVKLYGSVNGVTKRIF